MHSERFEAFQKCNNFYSSDQLFTFINCYCILYSFVWSYGDVFFFYALAESRGRKSNLYAPVHAHFDFVECFSSFANAANIFPFVILFLCFCSRLMLKNWWKIHELDKYVLYFTNS